MVRSLEGKSMTKGGDIYMKKAMMLMVALLVGLSFGAMTFAGEGGDKGKDKPKTEKPKDPKK
jgi:hypothetical protein